MYSVSDFLASLPFLRNISKKDYKIGDYSIIILHRFSLSMDMSRLTRNGTAETVSRDQILRHERGQGNITFSCSAEHEQDWHPYPVDPYSCYMCDHTYYMIYTASLLQGLFSG